MPRQKNATNKSAAIREFLQQNADAPVKEVIEKLGGQGIKVKPNLVYFIKAKMRAGKRKKARQQAVQAVSTGAGQTSPIELIRKVKSLAAEVGGLKKLKELTEILAS